MPDPDRPRKPKVDLGKSQRISKPSVLPSSVKPSRGPNAPKLKVSQKTIDSMKTMGMTKAIQKANSGNASPEFVEGAKRMYGNRIKPVVSSSPVVSKSASSSKSNAPRPKSKPGPVVAARYMDEGKGTSTKGNVKGKSGQRRKDV